MEAGTHTFDWIYVKDGSDGSTFIADDCAWVDLITFPSITPLATGTLAGAVSVLPAANLQEVEINFGSTTINPDASGQFSLEVTIGLYDVTASLTGYETITIEDVLVQENQVTSISFVLHYLQSPENLIALNLNEVVSLSWEHNQPAENYGRKKMNSSREFLNFNIYRNVNNGVFQLLDSTEELTYEDILTSAGEYGYYITAVYDQGNESGASNTGVIIWDGTGAGEPVIPLSNALYQNSPNPFNPETAISFSIAEGSENTEIVIYNLKGQKIKTLVNETLSTGQHAVIWNGTDDNGKAVASGIYLYQLKAGIYTASRKMILLR